MVLGWLGGRGGAGEADVGHWQGGQRWVSEWSYSDNFCVICNAQGFSWDAQKGVVVVIVVCAHHPDLDAAIPFVLSHPPTSFLFALIWYWPSTRPHHSPTS